LLIHSNFVEKNSLLRTIKKTKDKWDENEFKKKQWINKIMWKKEGDSKVKLQTGFSVV